MDKRWMQLNRLDPSFGVGVEEFIKFAYSSKEPYEKIPCPCYKCSNFCDQTQEVVRYHLSINGIMRSYIRWVYHGEAHEDDLDNEENIEDYTETSDSYDENDGNDLMEMLTDISNANLGNNSNSVENLTNPGAPFPLGRADTYMKLLKDSEKKLYNGCESYSKLSFLVKLLHIKTMNGWTNKSFDMLLELLKDAFQGVDVDLPKSYSESKKLMRELGFTYTKIHSCVNDCVLFWKEFEHLDDCPKCKTCRWKDKGSKKIPCKVLRYFPLKPRLQRLFVNKDFAEEMRWHKEKLVHEENTLRHPADSESWRDFDEKYPLFSQDPRNIRLGLASDGFTPFANMGTSYSIWPVILVPYNLPPWMCMKDTSLILSMLIPGPKGPGNDIDVYLQPLIDELNELWGPGIETYDEFVGVNSQYAITESGCLTRKNAPLQMTKWAKIDENKKLGLLRDFKSSFSYGESQRCENTIFAQMNIQYRNYRHKLYKNYFLKGVVPPNVEKEDWEYLTDYFGSDEYQAMSRRNTENRAKAKDDAKHIAGTRSFARICREREEKKMDVVKQIELYKITHCRFDDESEEGCWVNEAAKENYCRMLEIRNQKIDEGEVEVDEEQICGEVLGFKSGYIRGRGAGPKPNRSLPHRNYGKELEEANKHAKLAHERAEKAEQQLTVFFEQLEKQQSVIQDLKEGLAATQKAMAESHKSTAEMMSVFGQFRPTNQFSAMSQWFPTPPNYAHHSMQGFMHGYSSQNIQNSNTESDELSGEPGLRELIHEVSRYPISAPFQR